MTMMGPSAPKGPPVPMAMAAERGLASAVRGAMRLCLVRIASMASGIPWPLMTGAHRAMTATTMAPPTATRTTVGLRWRWAKEGRFHPTRWKNARFVSRAMRWTST